MTLSKLFISFIKFLPFLIVKIKKLFSIVIPTVIFTNKPEDQNVVSNTRHRFHQLFINPTRVTLTTYFL